MTRTVNSNKQIHTNPIYWVIFLLQKIGRICLYFIFFVLKFSYLFFYKIINFLTTEYNSVNQIINQLIKLINKIIDKIKTSINKNIISSYIYIISFFKNINTIKPKINFKIFIFNSLKILYLSHYRIVSFFININTKKKLKIKYKKLNNKRKKKSVKLIYIKYINNYLVKPLLIFSSLFIIAISVSFYFLILKDLPSPNKLQQREQRLTTKILARDGSLLYKIYRNQNRSLIKLENIPPYVINATIAVEDKKFWSHPGFSIEGIIRALTKNIKASETAQGGSTITQQLVKNTLLSNEKTYIRKIKEVILAIQVELIYTKEEILQMYFNEIPYGGTAYGIEEASETYFGKSVNELNIAEAAMLAGLPSAPTKYSPFGANPEFAVYRQKYTLKRMLEEGYITPNQYQQENERKIYLKSPVSEIKAPHFVMFVKDILVNKYGNRMVEEGGLEVLTSLDPDIQQIAQKAVTEEINKLIPMQVTNGAVLVTNPKNGEILAMVGSRDYFDTENDGNVNITIQQRQPGSSIKPITYALALKSGLTPNSIIQDQPVIYPDGPGIWYQPGNYDGKFHGPVTLKTALASSFNIPAVKLVDKFGVNNMINLAEKMGITTWKDRSRFGLSITLGGGEVKMIDMAVVYGVFANNGIRVDLNPILKVSDAKGKILNDYTCNSTFSISRVSAFTDNSHDCNYKQVLDPVVAYQISTMLSDDYARSPAFGFNSLLNIPNNQVAVKTGTTNDKRDNWAIGYTKNAVVTVWVGNNDNSPMSAVASGITGATPIWRNTMDGILNKNKQTEVFTPPSNMIPVQICATNGLLPCASCPQIKTEYFIPGTEPKLHCLDKQPEKGEINTK